MLEGTVQTPFGTADKKTVAMVGGFLVVIGGIVWYRSKKTATSDSTGAATEAIDPATGYAYGSAEDAAALAEQGSYVTPGPSVGSSGGGGGGWTPSPGHFATNSEWVQAALAYYGSLDSTADVTAMSAALGKYITGSPISTDTDKSLINQAIAAEDYPPVAGPNGYPPNINVATSGGTTTPKTLAPPTGLKATNIQRIFIVLTWNAVPGAVTYHVQWKRQGEWSGPWHEGDRTAFNYWKMSTDPNHGYYIRVQSINSANAGGAYSAPILVHSKK